MVAASAIVGVLGAWMLIAPFTPMSVDGKFFTDLLVGLVVANIGVTMVYEPRWLRLVVATIGCWICLSAFIPRLSTGRALTINDTIAGAFLVVLAMAAIHYAHQRQGTPIDGPVG